jgi:hypothetical protein
MQRMVNDFFSLSTCSMSVKELFLDGLVFALFGFVDCGFRTFKSRL